ncbi:MAG: HAMP domain-containing histidine kinase [Elusimicrobiota bacterium]|jgi:signal transduction histidine kinase|nr:HAMP domain-containing histidine kinase [Elusimicrobiota bacterium]
MDTIVLLLLGVLTALFMAKIFVLKKRLNAVENACRKRERSVYDAARDIHEKAQALETMVRRLSSDNAELARLNEVKSKMMSVVAHDLKQPLTSIQGYTSALADEEADNVTRKMLNNVVKSAANMTFLINDLVDASMLASGNLNMEFKDFIYNTLMDDIYTQYNIIAQERGVNFRIFELPQTINITADRHRINQVISNMLNNALKFTPEGGSVEIRYFTENGWLRTFVKDNGLGITAADRVKIFHKFQQADSMSDDYKSMGWGLGLSIAADIVHAHGGSIEVSSAGRGQGSIFWFSIPLEQQPQTPPEK